MCPSILKFILSDSNLLPILIQSLSLLVSFPVSKSQENCLVLLSNLFKLSKSNIIVLECCKLLFHSVIMAASRFQEGSLSSRVAAVVSYLMPWIDKEDSSFLQTFFTSILNLSSEESLQWMDDFPAMGFEKKVKSFLEKFVLGKNSSGGTSCAALIKSQDLSIAHLQPLPKPS